MEKQMEQARKLEKMKAMVEETRIAMMCTLEPDSMPRSRPMATMRITEDAEFLFFTDLNSVKNYEIELKPFVNLAYSNPGKNSFLSVSGTATVVNDMQLKEELWNPMASAWFPKGVEDPDLRIIKVVPQEAQYWDDTSSKMVQLFKMVKAAVSDEDYEAENEKISFR